MEGYIARAALGERAAFTALYDATSGKLHAVCIRVLGAGRDAEDAMQDAYVKVWRNAGRYRATGHSPMTWLITIARNTAIDRLRARRGDADVADYDAALAAPGATPEQSAVAASEAGRLVACLDELPADRRAAITGAYLDGRSYAWLAAEAGVPLNTMRTWLRRGLIALRACMAR
nr:sigma-70 family RNA polymerase sigma factor [Jannaschia sp. LMIT008]